MQGGANSNLINGRYKYKASPYDGVATGMTAYFGMWGMNMSAAEAFKEAPYTMVVTLKEDGSGVMAEYLSEGEDPFLLDLEWNKPLATAHPLGIDIEVTANLLAPNAIRMVTMAKEMMLSDVQTMTFTSVGIQKTSVASKPSIAYYGLPHNQVAAWSSFEERVDEDGNPSPLHIHTMPAAYFYG